eukprot:XP_001709462.1 Hypothetical protein GL50803_116271 [Giardia lamblia ATCC 50803]
MKWPSMLHALGMTVSPLTRTSTISRFYRPLVDAPRRPPGKPGSPVFSPYWGMYQRTQARPRSPQGGSMARMRRKWAAREDPGPSGARGCRAQEEPHAPPGRRGRPGCGARCCTSSAAPGADTSPRSARGPCGRSPGPGCSGP